MNKKLANTIMKQARNDIYVAREIFLRYGYEFTTTAMGYFGPMGVSNPNGDYILTKINGNEKNKYYKI